MKLKIAFFSLLAFSATGLNTYAANEATPEKLDGIAAIVNDDVITSSELEIQLENIRKQIRSQNTLPPPADILRKQVLEREIIKQIQLQVARNSNIFVDDATLNNAIENIAGQNNMNLREFRKVLEKDGYDFAQFREEIRQQIILTRLKQRDVDSRVNVTEQEVDNFINTLQIQGQSNDEFQVSHILISVPEAATSEVIEKTRLRAEKVLKDLRSGAEFKQMAISVSDGQQALEGGDLGWRKLGQLPTLFARLLPRLKKGDVSELIRSPSGFHIIKLMDKRTSAQHIITQTHARHILLRPNELSTESEIISRLRQLKERIESGDNFEELARSNSDDRASAAEGGSLGWASPGDMVPQFEAAMNSLKENQISEPFQSPFGWHIVQVLERRNLDNSKDFERKQAQELIRQRKIEEATDSWVRQLRDEAFVEIKLAI